MVDAMQQNPSYRGTHEQSPAEARAAYRALAQAFGPPEAVAAVEDRTLPGPAGEIPIRIYRASSEPALPVLVYYHGGGWVIGDLETHDRECRALCNSAGCIVVSVDYRLAPEHPFPAAVEDSWAALTWVAQHAASLGGDPDRLAVGGDSAGGNLAAVVALMARDAGGPALRHQLLIYPGVTGDTSQHASYEENAEAPFLPKRTIEYFMGHYFGPEQTTIDEMRAAPLTASSHADLPPALVVTAEYDPLRDEGRAYADKLEAAGVAVKYSEYPGMPHLFFQLSPILEEGKAALRESAEALRQAFTP